MTRVDHRVEGLKEDFMKYVRMVYLSMGHASSCNVVALETSMGGQQVCDPMNWNPNGLIRISYPSCSDALSGVVRGSGSGCAVALAKAIVGDTKRCRRHSLLSGPCLLSDNRLRPHASQLHYSNVVFIF